jgi:hypothetical protein
MLPVHVVDYCCQAGQSRGACRSGGRLRQLPGNRRPGLDIRDVKSISYVGCRHALTAFESENNAKCGWYGLLAYWLASALLFRSSKRRSRQIEVAQKRGPDVGAASALLPVETE